MKDTEKVLLIGLDGATWKLLKPWIDEGHLPNLARLCKGGSTGTLLSTIPSMTCPALPALFTGRNPANLGVLTFYDAEGNPVLINSYPGEKIWDVIQRNGGSSCIIDVRFTYPPPEINGVITCSTPLPADAKNLYYPPDLHKKLGRKVPLAVDIHPRVYKPGHLIERKQEIMEIMREWIDQRYWLIKDLTARNNYNFIFVWFSDLDSMQHIFWHDKDAILDHLKIIDEYLGKIVKDFANSDIIIISDHGFHKFPERSIYVNTWLMQEGFLNPKGSSFSRWIYAKIIKIYRVLMRISFFKKLFEKKRVDKDAIKQGKTIINDIYKNKFPGINWKTTSAYLFCEWGINIIKENIKEDYETFRNRLIEKMRNAKDDVGKPIFANVWKKEEVFKGKYINQIPDIVYQLSEDYYPDPIIASRKLFGKHQYKMPYTMTGNHENDREGIFIATGPKFSIGKNIGTARIEDIAPTIFHLLRCPMPDDLDGKTIIGAFTEQEKQIQDKYYSSEPIFENRNVKNLSNAEEESIKQQLKDMGYLSD